MRFPSAWGCDYMSKYGSRKVIRDGMKFDSVKEYRRFEELSLLEKAGAICHLERQVKFVLIPAQYEERKGTEKRKCIERECAYFADFVYYQNGEMVVEDTKGYKTEAYRIKRKLMLYIHGIKIKEI